MMTAFLGRSPILSLAFLIGMPPAFAQIVSAHPLPAPDKTAQQKPDQQKHRFVTPEKNKALQDFIIKNVYPLTVGAILLDYKISSQLFAERAADTTPYPEGVYNALKQFAQDTLDTIDNGTDHYVDGNMQRLAADANELEAYHWNGFKPGTPSDNASPNPDFSTHAWGMIEDLFVYNKASLPNGKNMLAVLQEGDEEAIFDMVKDSYIEDSGAKTEADKELVRRKTEEDAHAYAQNEIQIWDKFNESMARGKAQTFLGKDGKPQSVGEIMTVGALDRGLIMAVGEATANECIKAIVPKTPRTNSSRDPKP